MAGIEIYVKDEQEKAKLIEEYLAPDVKYLRALDALKENLLALVDALNKAKPAASKGIYLKKISITSTMGVGVRVDQTTLTA